VRKAKTVAAERDVTLYDLLDGILRPAIEREYGKLGRRLMDERREK
jgi:hypothetical protein